MSFRAEWKGEEIEVSFTADAERNDYGVPRSPVWYDANPNTIKIETLTILGTDVDPDTLYKAFPKLADAIHALTEEVKFS